MLKLLKNWLNLPKLQKVLISLALFLVIFTPAVSTFAQGGNCVQGKITIGSLFSPNSFVPIIEPQCSTDSKGRAIPLSFDVIPYVLLRSYGFLSSLIVYLFGFILIFSGIQYSYGALDGTSSVQALRNLKDSVVALLLVFASFAIVNTLLIILKVPGTVSNTNLTSFFIPIQ